MSELVTETEWAALTGSQMEVFRQSSKNLRQIRRLLDLLVRRSNSLNIAFV